MIGTRLGSWIIDKELGRGGMGCVYLAHRDPPEPDAPAQAAVKVLAAELAVEKGFVQRFEREIEILQQLNHPNIVRFFESGQQDTWSYYVMEYVEGPSFEKLVAQQGRLPWSDVLDLAWQLSPALKHAHDRGVIHRDLKPSNLLRGPASAEDLSAPSLIKLTDFGIAHLFASPHLTVTGGIVGTAEYLSPEQAAGKPVTRRSDLYSFGVVLYTLVTGRTPFSGDPLALLHKHRFAQFDRPARLVPQMPYEFDEIICQLLEKDPGKRPADAGVLFRRLDSLKRKLAFQATNTSVTSEFTPGPEAGVGAIPSNVEGPATLMSRLMRQELDRENLGGPVRQFFNRPWVLVTLLLLTVSGIVWAFWPTSAAALYERGSALMASADPDDWERAWTEYLEPLSRKDPDNPHKEELEQFRQRYESRQAERQAARAARNAGPMSEAQWFFQEGLRLRQQGDEAGAQRVWRSLVRAFKQVPSQGPWVRLAEKELGQGGNEDRQWAPVREAVQRANQLRQQGREREADTIVNALKELYRGDARAEAILKGE
jgi:serine/threonine protein kinase